MANIKTIEVLKKTNSHALISFRKGGENLFLGFLWFLNLAKHHRNCPDKRCLIAHQPPLTMLKGKIKGGEKQVPRIHINKIYPRKFKAMNRGKSKKYKPQLSTYANRSIVTWQPLKRTPSLFLIYIYHR